MFAGIPLATPDQLPQDYMRMLLHGPQGSGKTTLASTIAQIGHGDADPLGFSGQGKGGDCQQQHRKEG